MAEEWKEKYEALRVKYQAEVHQSRRLTNDLGLAQREITRLTAEAESLGKAAKERDRLAELCRKLQALQKATEQEEAAKRAEHMAKVGQTIGDVQTKMESLTQDMAKTAATNEALIRENAALRERGAAVAEAVDKLEAKYKAELELRVLEAKVAAAQAQKAEAIAAEERAASAHLRKALEEGTARDVELRGKVDAVLKAQEKHDELVKLYEARAKEDAKRIALLENARAAAEKQRSAGDASLLAMLQEKQKLETELLSATSQTKKALDLCKMLQGERKKLLEKLAEAGVVVTAVPAAGGGGGGGAPAGGGGEGQGDGEGAGAEKKEEGGPVVGEAAAVS